MDSQDILLMHFGAFEKTFLERVADSIQKEFFKDVLLKDGHMELEGFFDSARRQYNGDKIIRTLEAMKPGEGRVVLGLFDIDLFIPILTYIFGQAHLGGNTAIVSTYRLRNELYGIMPNDELFVQRTIKEAIHELGHTCGLIHCLNPVCVMRASSYVEDIDQKEARLCIVCRKLIS